MRQRTRLVLGFCVALTGGCEADPSPEERLAGTWGTDTGDGCAAVFTFTDDDRYSGGYSCELESGGFGLEIERGDYDADDKRITLRPTAASCPDHNHDTDSASYKLSGDALTLTTAKGGLVLQRLPKGDSGSGGVVKFGCWNNDQTFTPGKLEKL